MIRLFDYQRGLPELEGKLAEALHRVLHSGQLILGPETAAFEQEFADWLGIEHCVAVTSGTAALFLALKAAGIGAGDEVITVSNTCPPTISAIRMAGADPVFVDVDAATLMMDMQQVEDAITARSACVLPVHLWGNSVDLDRLKAVADRHNLVLIEDCAQATGTRFSGSHVGTFGAMGCFSFYPTKNLGAYGDGGAVVTSDAALAHRLRMLRMYGYDGPPISLEEGVNARISELQAAFLRIRLAHLDRDLDQRRSHAQRLKSIIRKELVLHTAAEVQHSYHQFVIRTPARATVTTALDQAAIQWAIHYQTPTHVMPAFKRYHRPLPVTERAATEIVSVPIHEHLHEHEVSQIAAVLGGL